MKCILLAAGYGTRLYPITKNTPKPLLKINGKTILDHVLEKVKKVEIINDIYLVTNDKFYNDFKKLNKNMKVLNDGTTSNENIKDLDKYICKENNICHSCIFFNNTKDRLKKEFLEEYEEKFHSLSLIKPNNYMLFNIQVAPILSSAISIILSAENYPYIIHIKLRQLK